MCERESTQIEETETPVTHPVRQTPVLRETDETGVGIGEAVSTVGWTSNDFYIIIDGSTSTA